MPNSQFNHQATLGRDGIVQVTGTITSAEPVEGIEFRFLIVQDNVVVDGTGQQLGGSGWSGTTRPGQAKLQAGPARAIGLALLAMKQPDHGLGFETFTWSDQIELQE